MNYSKVYIDSIGYEIAPVVVSSLELERRLKDVYSALHLAEGQLEALTGILERRWWEEVYRVSDGAIAAARRALEISNVRADDLGALIYGAVCREYFEPATACRVASGIGIGPEAAVYDVSNACLGVLNGLVEVANRIEFGQIRAGMVVACETSREINEIVIEQLLQNRSMEFFKSSLATLTGGSGAVAMILTDGSFSTFKGASYWVVSGGRLLSLTGSAGGALNLHIPMTLEESASSPRQTRRRSSRTESSWVSRPGELS